MAILFKSKGFMLILNDSLFLGKGTHRRCYLHPANPGLCVKVLLRANDKSDLRQIKREASYTAKLNKQKPALNFITKFGGTAATNMGTGYIFELVKDFDGKISESLTALLNDKNLLDSHFDRIVKALKVLKNELYDNAIVLKNFYPVNLLYKKTSPQEGHFVIIDDIGAPSAIPAEYWFKTLARKKQARYWKRYFIWYIETNYDTPKTRQLVNIVKNLF